MVDVREGGRKELALFLSLFSLLLSLPPSREGGLERGRAGGSERARMGASERNSEREEARH